VVYQSETEMYPNSVSPDGRFLSIHKGGIATNYDLWVVPLTGDGDAYPVVEGEFNEWGGMFSPDGKWIAYVSDESGRPEVYLTSFIDRGRKWQVSTGGGQGPRWSSDGSEIIYHSTDGTLISVSIEARDGGLFIGQAKPLFNTQLQPFGPYFWALSGDDERVLTLEPTSNVDEPNLSVVVNWPSVGGRS